MSTPWQPFVRAGELPSEPRPVPSRKPRTTTKTLYRYVPRAQKGQGKEEQVVVSVHETEEEAESASEDTTNTSSSSSSSSTSSLVATLVRDKQQSGQLVCNTHASKRHAGGNANEQKAPSEHKPAPKPSWMESAHVPRAIMSKYGWRKGQGIGRGDGGLTTPLKVQLRRPGVGLGHHNAHHETRLQQSQIQPNKSQLREARRQRKRLKQEADARKKLLDLAIAAEFGGAALIVPTELQHLLNSHAQQQEDE